MPQHTDNIDGNISVSLIENNVTTSTEGNYTIRYKAVDNAGNVAITERQVIVAYAPFMMRIKTDNSGVSTSNEFQIPVDSNAFYNYEIDCDSDGTPEASGISGAYTCTYAQAGEYNITISGTFPSIRFLQGNNTTDASKVLDILQWGSIVWRSMYGAFYRCDRMQISASDTPILYMVDTMRYMFGYASSFNTNLDEWNVSNVKDMAFMFRDAFSFNGSIASWDTHNVTDMSYIFYHASSFDQPIGD